MTVEEMKEKLLHVQRNPKEYFENLRDMYGKHEIYLWSDDGERWCIVCDLDDGDGAPYEIGHIVI